MTLTLRTISMIIVTTLAAYGCKSNEFTGSSAPKPGVEKKDETPTTPATTTGKPLNPADKDPPEDKDDDPALDDTDDTANPNIGTDTDDANKPSLLDLISGLKKILKPADTVDDENRVVFGSAKGFHIGDGAFSPSSNCSGFLTIQPISGNKYYFEFEVKLDDTVIDIKINDLCGVDYADSNFASIEDAAGTSLQRKPIIDNSPIVYNSMTLKAGNYKMVVESALNAANNNDRDDFFVKKLEIKSNKPIKAGKVGAM